MPTIPAGATIRDKATGQIVGHTTTPTEIHHPGITTEKLARAIASASAPRLTITLRANTQAMRDTLEEVIRFITALGRSPAQRRLLALRYQAKRKGRPGWRHIPIPRVRPGDREPFAHDDRIDALPAIPLRTR